MHEVIIFLQTFDKYKQFTYQELWLHIQQSFFYNQYKIFRDEDKKIFGFINWAWVDEKTKEQYFKTGKVKKWNCGNNLVTVNFVAKKIYYKLLDCLFNNIPLSVSSKSFVPKSGTSGFIDLENNQPIANTPKAT